MTRIIETTAASGRTNEYPKKEYKIVGTVMKSGEPSTNEILNSSKLFTKQKIVAASKLGFKNGRKALQNTVQ